jgi:hypothetical protein
MLAIAWPEKDFALFVDLYLRNPRHRTLKVEFLRLVMLAVEMDRKLLGRYRIECSLCLAAIATGEIGYSLSVHLDPSRIDGINAIPVAAAGDDNAPEGFLLSEIDRDRRRRILLRRLPSMICHIREIIGESVHWIDLACWLFAPQLPCEITAWGSSRLSHGIYLKFNGGASMTLDFSCSGTFDYPKEQFELTHNAALFRCLHFVENEYYGFPGAGKEFFNLQNDPYPEMGDGFENFKAKYFAKVQNSTNSKLIENTTPLTVDKGHRAMLDGFIDAILNDKPSPCDEMAGFRSTYLARLAIQSIRTKQTLPVQIEDITPCIF